MNEFAVLQVVLEIACSLMLFLAQATDPTVLAWKLASVRLVYLCWIAVSSTSSHIFEVGVRWVGSGMKR